MHSASHYKTKTLMLLIAVWVGMGSFLVAAPGNDLFSFRSLIAGTTANGSTSGASVEAGEPVTLPGYTPNASAWWSWSAPASGWVEVDTVGSAFDTVVSVYTGTGLTTLTRVAANDDDPTTTEPTTASRVRFEAVLGTIYQIAVGGFAPGDEGAVALKITAVGLPTQRLASVAFSPNPANVTTQSSTVTITFNVATTSSLTYGTFDLYQNGGGLFESMVFSATDRTSGTATNGTYRLLVSIPRYMASGALPFLVNVATAASEPNLAFVCGGFGWQGVPTGQLGGLPVTNTGAVDAAPPVLNSLTVAPASADVSLTDQLVEVTLSISDTLTGFRSGTLSLTMPIGGSSSEFLAQTTFSSMERISGTGASGTYLVTLALPQDAPAGMASVLAELRDAAGNQLSTTTGSVLVVKDAWVAWATSFNLTGADALPDADTDRDGLVNRIEFALNLDPLVNARPDYLPAIINATLTPQGKGVLPQQTITGPPSAPIYKLSFLRRRGTNMGNLTEKAQFSSNLSTWDTASAAAEITIPLSATWEWVTVSDPAPHPNHRFSRIQISP